MFTIVITTKNTQSEYDEIVANWFTSNVRLDSVTPSINLALSGQSGQNTIRVAESGEYRVVLPQVVKSDIPVQNKSEYVLDLLCSIAKKFKVAREDLFFVVHSSDLFTDKRAGYGNVPIESLDCREPIRTEVARHIAEGHIFQFHHGHLNDVTAHLFPAEPGQDISVLGQALMSLF